MSNVMRPSSSPELGCMLEGIWNGKDIGGIVIKYVFYVLTEKAKNDLFVLETRCVSGGEASVLCDD